MCNSKNHSPSCTCGFGGYGHLGKRGAGYYSPAPAIKAKSGRDLFIERYPEFRKKGRVAGCFVSPNATCPVCGDRIYYYQNEHGSRVFFDELGPPWPKHPCTDRRLSDAPLAGTQLGTTFDIRSQSDVVEIFRQQEKLGIDVESDFTTMYGTARWPLARIVTRIKSGRPVFIMATLLQQGKTTKAFFSCKSLPQCCRKGFLIAIKKRKISFLDTGSMTPLEISIVRHRGARRFLDAIENAEIFT